MIFDTIPPLLHMCATSVVYRIWTRHNIYEQPDSSLHWQFLEDKVTADLNQLPLPKPAKLLLLSLVKCSGRHYFGFLTVWLTKVSTTEIWLTEGMLSDCLTLYPVGIINQRKTAEKLLRSKVLDNAIAFRLACINFLDEDVIRLWPRVSKYFLNNIVLAPEKLSCTVKTSGLLFYKTDVKEPREVLFWIGYCLSIARFPDLVPHFDHSDRDWFRDALWWAGICGDTVCFEYMKNSFPQIAFSHENELKNLCLDLRNNFLIFFFYHFSSLENHRRKHLLNEVPTRILLYFLQWPLSSLFLKDPEGLCDILKEHNLMDWLFVKILEILHGKKYFAHHIPPFHQKNSPSLIELSDVYNKDHLERIWIVLWKISPVETRSRIMVAFAFTDTLNNFLVIASPQLGFDSSTFTNDLKKLFISTGEAILLFLSKSNLSDALEIVVSKYMPERNLNFQFFQSQHYLNHPNYLTYDRFNNFTRDILDIPVHNNTRIVAGLHLPKDHHRECAEVGVYPKKTLFKVSEIKTYLTLDFVSYIQKYLNLYV